MQEFAENHVNGKHSYASTWMIQGLRDEKVGCFYFLVLATKILCSHNDISHLSCLGFAMFFVLISRITAVLV